MSPLAFLEHVVDLVSEQRFVHLGAHSSSADGSEWAAAKAAGEDAVSLIEFSSHGFMLC